MVLSWDTWRNLVGQFCPKNNSVVCTKKGVFFLRVMLAGYFSP